MKKLMLHRRIGLSTLLAGFLASSVTVAQHPDSTLDQARSFMADYEKALIAGDRGKIGNLYHPNGAYFSSVKFRFHEDINSIKQRYLENWDPPLSFEWCDLHYDVLSPDVVNVLGYFNWTSAEGVFQMTYVGTLQKVDGAFRIRLEEESNVPSSAHSEDCPR